MTPVGLLKRITLLAVVPTLILAAPVLAGTDRPIRVGVYHNAPLIDHDEKGRVVGFFADLLARIAEREGWRLEYAPGSWEECLRRLDSGAIDLIPVMAHTPERAARYRFSEETVFTNWGQIFRRTGVRIESILDLDGQSVAVMKGNVYYDGPQGLKALAEKFSLHPRFVECADYRDVLRTVGSGGADAGLVSRLSTPARSEAARLEKTSILLSPVSVRLAFAKTADPLWRQACDTHLRAWKKDPQSIYHQLLIRWISGTKGYAPPSWLMPALRIMGISLALLLGITLLSRIQLRKGLRELSRKNQLLEKEVADRRQAQEALARQTTFFEAAFNSVPDGLVLCDTNQEIVRCNPGTTRIFGYAPRELLGRKLSILYAREDEYEEHGRLRSHPAAEEPVLSAVVNYRRKDGTVFLGEIQGMLITSGEGEVLGCLSSMRDVSERWRAREALQWELKVNRAIAELSRLLLHFSSMDEISHVILAEAKELTGSPHGFVGFIDPRTGAMVSPTLTPEIWAGFARQPLSDKKFAFRHFRGLWGWVLTHRQPILCNDPETDHRSTGIPEGHMAIRRFIGAPAMADEKLLGIIALANSERDYHAKDLELLERLASMYALAVQNMRSAQTVRESEERFRAIFEHAGVGMATIAPDGRYLQVNPAYCQLVGYTPEEFLKLSVEDITHPDDLAITRGLYEDVRQGRRRFFSYEKRFIHKIGRVVWVSVTVACLLDEDGKPAYAVAQVQDVTERKEAELRLLENEERFKYLAHHDCLTGLPNRLLFSDRLLHALSKARRGGHLLALLFFDLDRFKAINDAHGHEAGDLVLQTVARRLQSLVREADTVARFGGDEFIVLLEDIQDIEGVKTLANKILLALANPLTIQGETLVITSSIGISLFPADGTDGEMLIKKADDAMFKAKEKGRNLFLFYDSSEELPPSIVNRPPDFDTI